MPKGQGSVGDKAPSGVRNYASVTMKHTVDARAAMEKNATFTREVVGVPAKSNAQRTTS